MQLEFRNLVLQLTPEQIIPQAIRYQIKKRSGGTDPLELSDSSTISNNILSVILPFYNIIAIVFTFYIFIYLFIYYYY